MQVNIWKIICSLSCKTMNARENFWNVYCFTTNQMWHGTAKDNRQTAALKSQDLMQNNELDSSTRILQFYRFQILKFFFLNFSFSIPKEWIWMTFYGKAILNQEDSISRSDTARLRVWKQEKIRQSHTTFLCFFMCSSKGHASWLWLVVFNLYFFVAEKPLPMMRTCTVVNFHNLHSLLGQFSSLVFEQMESSD